MTNLAGTTAETLLAANLPRRLRAVIYCRISKDRFGAGEGVERQEDACRGLAAEHPDWDVVTVYVDNDVSAFSGRRRKDYQRMLAAVRAGQVDVIIAWHHDRLHRSSLELEEYIVACKGVPTYCVQASAFGMDLTTATGQLQARFGAAMALHEAQHMSERITAQKLREFAKGEYTGGGKTFGYERAQYDAENNILNPGRAGRFILEAEAEAFRAAAKRVIAGDSIYAICADWRGVWKTPHGNEWSPKNLRRLLMTPKHAGIVSYKGQILDGVPGLWEAIITPEQHHALVAILRDPARTPKNSPSGRRTLRWVGSGLYRCICGEVIRSGGSRSRIGTAPAATYRCSVAMQPGAQGKAKHVAIRADWADAYVIDRVGQLLEREGPALLRVDDGGQLTELRSERETIHQVLFRLDTDFYDAEGDLFKQSRVQVQRERFEKKLEDINARLEMLGDGADPLAGVADAPSPQAAFLALNVPRQRAVIDAIYVVEILPPVIKGRRPASAPVLPVERVRLTRREESLAA